MVHGKKHLTCKPKSLRFVPRNYGGTRKKTAKATYDFHIYTHTPNKYKNNMLNKIRNVKYTLNI